MLNGVRHIGPGGSCLPGNLYMRRFIQGWKMLGYARRYRCEIVNCADDFRVVGKAPAAGMLVVVKRLIDRLKLPISEQKTPMPALPEPPTLETPRPDLP